MPATVVQTEPIFPSPKPALGMMACIGMVDFHHEVLLSTTNTGNHGMSYRTGGAELPLDLGLRYSQAYGENMITPDVLTEYVRQVIPDAAVTVSDRTGTMDHLKVVVVSAAFAGKNLLDRHRMIYQALDVPLKDGRIHALELTARTSEEL